MEGVHCVYEASVGRRGVPKNFQEFVLLPGELWSMCGRVTLVMGIDDTIRPPSLCGPGNCLDGILEQKLGSELEPSNRWNRYDSNTADVGDGSRLGSSGPDLSWRPHRNGFVPVGCVSSRPCNV
mmetsp:Transcript_3297/g.3175  ORF Transcript_3297/g.3175 Transcript_3297/m.3175 type:complete len:124 (+) Transcript_3297:162-533(+)